MSKIISVFGSPGSGKTTTAGKLAYMLAQSTGKDTILLSCDNETPLLPVLFPFAKKDNLENKSVGKILTAADITQNVILQNAYVSDSMLPLVVIGYTLGENAKSYPTYMSDKMRDMLMQMSQMTEYLIIDCTCDIVTNELTAFAISQSDKVLQIYKPEHRSEVYFSSQRRVLENETFKYNDFVRILRPGISKKRQAINETRNIGDIKYEIPYSFSLIEQYESGELLSELSDKSYNNAIYKIINKIIKGEEKDE